MAKPKRERRDKPDIFMPLYIGDYLGDTSHLTRDQHGGYLLLLMAYWKNGGPLDDDDTAFAAITKATAKEWGKLRPIMARFFQLQNGKWNHRRCDTELTLARAAVAEASAKGKKAAAARWDGGKPDASAMHGHSTGNAQAMHEHMHMHNPSIAYAMPVQCYSPSPSPSPSQHPDYPEEDNLGGSAQSSAPPPEDEPIPAFLDRRKPRPERPKAERGTRLPDDWEPPSSLLDLALTHGMTPDEFATEIDKFRDHWRQSSRPTAVKRDWDAAARNWIRNARNFSNGHAGKPPAQNPYDTFIRGAARAAARITRERELAAEHEAAGHVDGGGELA